MSSTKRLLVYTVPVTMISFALNIPKFMEVTVTQNNGTNAVDPSQTRRDPTFIFWWVAGMVEMVMMIMIVMFIVARFHFQSISNLVLPKISLLCPKNKRTPGHNSKRLMSVILNLRK